MYNNPFKIVDLLKTLAIRGKDNTPEKPLNSETLDVIKNLKNFIHKVCSSNKAELDCLIIEIYNYIMSFRPLKLFFEEQVQLYENFIKTDECDKVYEKLSATFRKVIKDDKDIESIDLNWWQTYCATKLPILNYITENVVNQNFDFSKITSLLIFYYVILILNRVNDLHYDELTYLNGLEFYFYDKLINDGIIVNFNDISTSIVKVVLISVLNTLIIAIKAKSMNLVEKDTFAEFDFNQNNTLKSLTNTEKDIFMLIGRDRLSVEEISEQQNKAKTTINNQIKSCADKISHLSRYKGQAAIKEVYKKYF